VVKWFTRVAKLLWPSVNSNIIILLIQG